MPPIVPKTNFNNFSEERARIMLKKLTDLGPRPSGSYQCEVILKILKKFNINKLKG